MPEQHIVYRVGKLIIDPLASEIRKEEGVVKITQKEMSVLEALIKANKEVLTKKDFAREVWGDTIVTDNSIMKIISELRRVLGDERSNPKFIQTIPKVGYRFINNATIELKSQRPLVSFVSNKNWVFIILGVLFVGIIGSYYLMNKPQLSLEELNILSTDGTKVANFNVLGDSAQISIDDVSSRKTELLISIGTPESLVMSWAPNDEYIVYNATQRNDPFFTVCVLNLETKNVMYVRSAKEEDYDLNKITGGIDSIKEIVDHREIISGFNEIEYLYLYEGDTLKLLIKDGTIRAFEW